MRNQNEINNKIRKKEMLIRQLRRDCVLKIAALAVLVAAAWMIIPAANNLVFAAENNLVYAAGNNLVYAAKNIPACVEIPLKYAAEGDEVAREFVLKAEDPANPMPEGSVNGEHRIVLNVSTETSLGTITYYRPGEYNYTVRSDADPSVYRLQVIATNEGQGSLIIRKTGEEGKTELTFRSMYGGSGEDNGGSEDGEDQSVDPTEDPFADPGVVDDPSETTDPGILTLTVDDPDEEDKGSVTPQTGDETAVILWIALAGASLICLIYLLAAARFRSWNRLLFLLIWFMKPNETRTPYGPDAKHL